MDIFIIEQITDKEIEGLCSSGKYGLELCNIYYEKKIKSLYNDFDTSRYNNKRELYKKLELYTPEDLIETHESDAYLINWICQHREIYLSTRLGLTYEKKRITMYFWGYSEKVNIFITEEMKNNNIELLTNLIREGYINKETYDFRKLVDMSVHYKKYSYIRKLKDLIGGNFIRTINMLYYFGGISDYKNDIMLNEIYNEKLISDDEYNKIKNPEPKKLNPRGRPSPVTKSPGPSARKPKSSGRTSNRN